MVLRWVRTVREALFAAPDFVAAHIAELSAGVLLAGGILAVVAWYLRRPPAKTETEEAEGVMLEGEDKIGKTIVGYTVERKLGRGGFGEVFRCTKGKAVIAVKVAREGTGRTAREVRILNRLHSTPGVGEGFPQVKWQGANCFGLEILGPSLESLRRAMPDKRLSVKTVLQLALQMLERIQHLHSRYLVHRDIKPDNFLMGVGSNANRVYLVDFGLTTRYITSTCNHVPYREGRTVYGTAYFSSTNADAAIEQSRRDDLASLGYVMVYLCKGTLPWIGLRSQGPRKTWHSRVVDMKARYPIDDLCAGLPKEFAKWLRLCYKLGYDEHPGYSTFTDLLVRAYSRLGCKFDDQYDWTNIGAAWPCWSEGGPPPNEDVSIEITDILEGDGGTQGQKD